MEVPDASAVLHFKNPVSDFEIATSRGARIERNVSGVVYAAHGIRGFLFRKEITHEDKDQLISVTILRIYDGPSK